MLNFKIVGAGAAGNKAVISHVKNGFNIDDVVLLNSTSKDISEEYKDKAIIFGSNPGRLGGCGKEREIGKSLILNDMKNKSIDLDSICDPDTNAVVIVTSTEGGSGSAATPILAKYFKEVIGLPVIVVLLFGFLSDVRGLQNSIEICQELQDSYTVIGISNAKFIEKLDTKNTVMAEKAANEQFSNIMDILIGKYIHEGSQNIDDTDLFKLVTTPGYTMVESADISKVKNIEQYNKILSDAIDDSTLIDVSIKGAKRIGVIYTTPEDKHNNIDLSANIIKEAYGTPYEMFTHIQKYDNEESVTWIAAGMPMPIKELQNIYDTYLKITDEVNKSADKFFDSVTSMKGNSQDNMFNMLSVDNNQNTKSKDSFFADFGIEQETKSVKGKSVKKKNSISEY